MTNDEARHPKLWAMIEMAAEWATKSFDGTKGPDEPGLVPAWMWEDAKGERGIIGTPFTSAESKVVAAAAVRLEFEKHDAIRYVFTSETWMREVSCEEAEREERDGVDLGNVRDHYDRREYVYHQAEDASGAEVSGRQAVIRTGRRRATLGPLERVDWKNAGGRFSGMLSPRSDADRIRDTIAALNALRRSAK